MAHAPTGTEPERSPGLAVDAALLVMTLFWAANIIVLKLLLGEMPPLVLSALRFSIVTVVAFGVVAGRGGPWRIEGRDWPRFLATSVLGISLYQVLFIHGLSQTAAFTANLIQGTEPLFALLFVRLLRAGVVRPRQWAGILVAFSGAVVFFLESPGGRPTLRLGLGEAENLVSAASFAAYGIVAAPLFGRYPGRTVMAYSMLLGTLPLALLAFPQAAGAHLLRLPALAWAGVLYSSIFPVYVGYWIWNWAIRHKGVAHASLYLYVDIVMSGVLAHALLAENFGALRLLGAGIIMMGIALARPQP